MKTPVRLFLAALLVSGLTVGIAHAEKADRSKPVNLEADRVTVDDIKRVHVFEGNVLLSQGTLSIKSAKLVEGKEEYIEGEGERIEYDSRAEKSEFFTRAYVKSGIDEVRGNYILYDGITEQYLVTAVPGAKPGTPAGRVTATIQPKSVKNAAPAPAAPATPAKP